MNRVSAAILACTLALPTASAARVASTHTDRPAARMLRVADGETLAVFSARVPSASVSAETPLTVVLLPGPIGSAFSMRHVTSVLAADGIHAVVIDLLGMGASARPTRADYSLTSQANRIAAALDSLHIARALVVGQGTSATVALHLAASQPARVAAVLSLAGGPVDAQGTRGVRMALALAPLLDNALGRAIGRRKFRAGVREQSASDAWCTDSVMREYLRPYDTDLRGSLRALKAMSESTEPAAIATRLASVRADVRMLVGDKQSANSPTGAQIALLTSKLVRFRLDTVARAGTMLQEERPDAVTAAIVALLRTNTSDRRP